MFYGAGAGKLPTASAVVSDVVDAVKHMGTNIMTIWSQEKQKLVDMKDAKTRFFIRVKGSVDEGLDEIKALFGNGQVISIPGYDDEFGFVTEEITEGTYAAGAAECDKIITRIRYEK